MRNKLIEILKAKPYGYSSYEDFADYLLAEGVFVPPCKIGDFIEWDTGVSVTYHEIKGFVYNPEDNGLRFVLDICTPTMKCLAVKRILTREEVEQALKGANNDN